MKQPYPCLASCRTWLWSLLLTLLVSPSFAQSGPVGNEWIVPGQQYYKVKILKDGLYKLDYQYLTQAGITGVVPNELQVWRRGREIATYVGGNRTTLDPTTFIEFYAVHNDGKLDAGLYKNPAHQPHHFLSLYTDSASYFITWRAGTAGKHMAEPVQAGGTPHPHRLRVRLDLKSQNYLSYPVKRFNYLPWLESGEGYFRTAPAANTVDSVVVSAVTSGPAPRVELAVVGAADHRLGYGGVGVPHNTEVKVMTPTGSERLLGVLRYVGRVVARGTFPLLPSDISSTGEVTIKLESQNPATDFFFPTYFRTVAPEANAWYANRSRVLFANDSLLGGPATYELSNLPATVVGFDIDDFENVQRIAGTAGSATGRRRFVFPGATAAATHQLMLADEAAAAVPPVPARRVRFRVINPATPTFVIITHPQLMKPAGSVPNAAQAYAAYRASAAGGRHDTLMMTSHQLYDQFFYGDKSWLSMRHFARWLAAASPAGSSRYLFLLGKGISPQYFREPGGLYGRYGEGLDLVPTSSQAVSDNLLTADYQNSNYVPQLTTGRLTVTTPAQIIAYLNKIKEHDALGDAPWRKNALNLAGGNNPGEFVTFQGYMDRYKQLIERPYQGGKVVRTYKRNTVGGYSSSPVSIDVSRELNEGVGVINYFGHGSNTEFDLNINDISDPLLTNKGKYPVLLYNGCAAAQLFVGYNTFFENYLLTPDKGAIGAMGEVGYGYAYVLHPMQERFTRLLFNSPQWYGRPVAAVHSELIRQLTTSRSQVPDSLYFSDSTNYSHSLALETLLSSVWHGDPTIRLYAPPKPDFQTSDAQLSIAAGTTAASSTFTLNIGVSNPLKITFDSVRVRVTRLFDPSATPRVPDQVFTRTFRQAWQRDTTYAFALSNPAGLNVFGTNTFRVEIDYPNRVDEASETNNTAQLSFTFLKAGVTVLTPREFAIAGSRQPHLVAQTNDPNGPLRGFDFEIDTVATFSSPLGGVRQQRTVRAAVVASWQPTLPAFSGRDSVVWYWRVRFQQPVGDEDASWQTSSFRVLPGSPGGWSQSHYAQFRRDERQGVEVAAPTGRWAFSTENQPIQLRTKGGGTTATPTFFGSSFGILTDLTQQPNFNAACGIRVPNVMVAVYDQRTLLPKTVPGNWTRCAQTSAQQFYVFGANLVAAADTINDLNNSATRQAELTSFLGAVSDGDYVALISVNRLRWADLPTVTGELATLLGARQASQLRTGDPYALLAQKYAAGGRLIQEAGPAVGPNEPPRYDQVITLRDTLRTPSSRGTVTSTRIGPAQNWQTLYHQIVKESATSTHTLRVVGIDTLGNRTVLLPDASAGGRQGVALSGIPARQYPYLQLELMMKDSLNRAAPQLRQWLVTYQGFPEGIVRRDSVAAAAYDPAQLALQAASQGVISFPVKFQNVTDIDFGTPLKAKVEVSGGGSKTVFVTAPALKANSTITVPVAVNVTGLYGDLGIKVTMNPRPQALPELYFFNNELNLAPFNVPNNNVPPVLDVAFDGRRILNGELVSPSPLIQIQMNEEDRLRFVRTPDVFTVSLQKEGSSIVPVDVRGQQVSFSVDSTSGAGSTVRLEYRPGQAAPLPDGIYTLRVQARDQQNTAAGSQNFEVKFEVVNASTITNVFPYPNPVTSKARFVFTVTGQELPRNMKIQIMTLTGRVVREIFMSELGPLRIGNNLTDYAWDGTDQYGDRLANGTYLYRVALDDAAGQFSQRRTAADQAFKNDWGKLVLMR